MTWLPDWLTGLDADNADRAAAADEELRRLNQEKIDRGDYTAAQAAQIERNYATQELFGVDAQRGQVQDAFDQELNQRAKGIFGTPLAALGDVLAAILKAVPLWVWLLAGLGLFLWLGGGAWLAKKSRNAFA